jgi:hypothetical protein
VRLSRDRLREVGVAVGTLALLAAGVVFCFSGGPLTLRPPATVLSHAHWVMQASEPYLLYLRSLRARLPAGASIVVLSPYSAQDPPTGVSYLMALGQLPDQRVVPWTVLRDGVSKPPRYVGVFRRGFHDDRYRLVSSTADEQLWECETTGASP